MSVIFLAECGSHQQAEVFAQHFEGVSWMLRDDIECECHAEIKQDLEGNWWCNLSTGCIDWTPATRAEANYRYFQITELQSNILERIKSAPVPRYAVMGELDLETLLGDSEYRITYQHLNLKRINLLVGLFKVGFILPDLAWREIGEPSKFEPLMSGYVWLKPIPAIIYGGIEAPPKDVITGKTMRGFIDPDQAEIYIKQGCELIAQEKLIEALENIEKAQKLNPFSAQIHHLKAVCLSSLKRLDEALQHCDLALQFALPQSYGRIIAYQLKGEILYEQGRFEESLERYKDALKACDMALELYPNAEPLHQLRSEILAFLIGRYEEALLSLNEAIRLMPNHEMAHYDKGSLLYTLGRYEEALLSLNEAIKLMPNHEMAHYDKGSLLYTLGRYEEALLSLNEATRLMPNHEMAHCLKGVCLKTLGRYEEALLSLNEATRLMPNHEMAHDLKGVCLDLLGYSQKAIESFDVAIRLNPNNAAAYQGKGIALDKLGRYKEALQALEYALQLNPNSPNTQNSIRIVTKHLAERSNW